MNDPHAFLTCNFLAAVKAVTPHHVLPRHIPAFPRTGRVIVLALGKAAEAMALTVLGLFENGPGFDPTRFSALAVIRKGDRLAQGSDMIDVIEAAHPQPDESSMAAARTLLSRAAAAGKDDTVLFLVSGGASALTLCPADGLSLQDVQAVNAALLKGGVPIDKMNTLRKHLSVFSGGRLRLASKARAITLAISDVPGDDLSIIGSGPTVADAGTFQDALDVVRDFKLEVPGAVRAHLEKGQRGEIEETLKPGDPRIAGDIAEVIASSSVAVQAGVEDGISNGCKAISHGVVEGEAEAVAWRMAQEAMEYAKGCTQPTLFVSGGELTVTLPKGAPGTGGRNSRFMLSFLNATQGANGIHAIACGTDGIDYIGAAGAVMTDQSWRRARELGLVAQDYLDRFDSHGFFEKLGGLVKTGATHTNTGDYRAILVLPRA